MKLSPHMLGALNGAIRALLPKDWDFALVAWRCPNADDIELTMIAQGDPLALEIALAECLNDVRNPPPVTAVA